MTQIRREIAAMFTEEQAQVVGSGGVWYARRVRGNNNAGFTVAEKHRPRGILHFIIDATNEQEDGVYTFGDVSGYQRNNVRGLDPFAKQRSTSANLDVYHKSMEGKPFRKEHFELLQFNLSKAVTKFFEVELRVKSGQSIPQLRLDFWDTQGIESKTSIIDMTSVKPEDRYQNDTLYYPVGYEFDLGNLTALEIPYKGGKILEVVLGVEGDIFGNF